MGEEFVFSIETIKDCNGHAHSDRDYLKFFLSECSRRIKEGSLQLHLFADGAYSFDSGTEAAARAAVAEVRRAILGLETCVEWFNGKRAIQARFIEALDQNKKDAEAAESDFATILRYLGLG